MYAVMLSMVCVAIVSIIGIFGVVEVKSKYHKSKKYNYELMEEAMQIKYINDIDLFFLGKKWANLPFHRVSNLHVLLPPDSCNRYHLMGG